MGARGRAEPVVDRLPYGRSLVFGRREERGHYRTSRGNYDDQIGKNHGS
jgi:hypothetical protein